MPGGTPANVLVRLSESSVNTSFIMLEGLSSTSGGEGVSLGAMVCMSGDEVVCVSVGVLACVSVCVSRVMYSFPPPSKPTSIPVCSDVSLEDVSVVWSFFPSMSVSV